MALPLLLLENSSMITNRMRADNNLSAINERMRENGSREAFSLHKHKNNFASSAPFITVFSTLARIRHLFVIFFEER